ncbi:hypothetical protein [Nocardia sp. NPDC060259]|uniref:hypothetical protein n=1 Tax=Nocardia sp. NPDC060259 TaxID=3347088 RepID=UPI003658E875
MTPHPQRTNRASSSTVRGLRLPHIEILRIFTDPDGRWGTSLGVVDGTSIIDPDERRSLADRLSCETVFIDDFEGARIQIANHPAKSTFAERSLIGAAWVLARELGYQPRYLQTATEMIRTWNEEGVVWIRGPLASTPPWWHERLDTAVEIEALTAPLPPQQDATQLWAWQDEAAGIARARAFATRFETMEDEACGSASMRLAAVLGRRLTINHGEGSVIFAEPGPPGTADIGGWVVSDGPLT